MMFGRRKPSFIVLSILWHLSLAALPIELRSQQQPGDSRLLHQMLQLFTPEEVTSNPMIPPYGINSKKSASPDLVENQRAIRNEAQFAMSPLAKMAEEVIGMFGTKPSTPPPTPATQEPVMANNFANLFSAYNMPMSALAPGLGLGIPATNLANSITSSIQADPNQAASYIDTGGQSFDRFVVHENQDSDNLLGGLGNSLMGRWNERGLQWSNGNLRLVNMRGNNLLGSQVAVHDRSVEIPVQQWLNMASNLFDTYRSP